MIPKLICFLFGHKTTWREFTGEYADKQEFNHLSGMFEDVPLYRMHRYDFCPRCDKKLSESTK